MGSSEPMTPPHCPRCGAAHATFACPPPDPPPRAPSWLDAIGCAPRCALCRDRPATPWRLPDGRPACFAHALERGGATDA